MKCWAAIVVLMTACADQSAREPDVLRTVPSLGTDASRELVLRAIAADDRDRYFVAYCVAAVPGEVAPAQNEEARVRTAWAVDAPDASRALLSRLSDLPHRFLPASDCMKTAGEYDVVVREAKRKPALLVGLGPIQVISKRRIEIVAFTTSGAMTETATAFSLERNSNGTWFVAGQKILLQV